MSAALCLTMAMLGAHDCAPGYQPSYGAYSYASPAWSGSSHASPGYAAPTPTMHGYSGSAMYGAPQSYGHAAPRAPMRDQSGYGPAGAQAQRGHVVQMTDRARFEPAQITINVGETVEWRNVSRHPHTVTADPGQAVNPAHVVLPQGAQPIHSGEVPPGDRFTHTFQTPGIYFYVCLPHEERGMVGIVVANPGPGGQARRYDGGTPPAPGSRAAD